MLRLSNKYECCGCEVCVNACPKGCIEMAKDSEGFTYPVVNEATCIDCGLCERVCPMLNHLPKANPDKCFAAYIEDHAIRKESSSGGIFSVLASGVIEKGGVVFGARFDKHWNVVHDYADTLEGISLFRGSKYVQSHLNGSYQKVKEFLVKGQQVLFSGTPCQVAGLHHFLRKKYDNLMTVDFICHGVPSSEVWQHYLKSVLKNRNSGQYIESISFRHKLQGWKRYGLLITQSSQEKETCLRSKIFETFTHNRYMNLFLSDLSLRPSCYQCRHRGFVSGSDITLGDFWGIDKIDPEIDDDKGVSLLFVHNQQTMDVLERSNILLEEKNISDATKYNPSIYSSVCELPYRPYFFKILKKKGDFDKAYDAVLSQHIVKKIARRLWLMTQN